MNKLYVYYYYFLYLHNLLTQIYIYTYPQNKNFATGIIMGLEPDFRPPSSLSTTRMTSRSASCPKLLNYREIERYIVNDFRPPTREIRSGRKSAIRSQVGDEEDEGKSPNNTTTRPVSSIMGTSRVQFLMGSTAGNSKGFANGKFKVKGEMIKNWLKSEDA